MRHLPGGEAAKVNPSGSGAAIALTWLRELFSHLEALQIASQWVGLFRLQVLAPRSFPTLEAPPPVDPSSKIEIRKSGFWIFQSCFKSSLVLAIFLGSELRIRRRLKNTVCKVILKLAPVLQGGRGVRRRFVDA
jgi:hypothetical protein